MEAQERIGVEGGAQRLVEYSDVGATVGAVNFPQAPAAGARPRHPLTSTSTRTCRANPPSRLIGIFSERGINIAGQYLQTDGEIGYVVVGGGTAWPESNSRENSAALRGLDRDPSGRADDSYMRQ